jgi:hypothetical protein
LTERLAATDVPDVVVGYRIKRADPLIRTLYARAYRLANRIFFGLKITDVDCACKLFRREALEGLRVESGGAFFSAEMIIKLRAAGRSVSRWASRTTRGPRARRRARSHRSCPCHPRLLLLRLRLWANRSRAMRRGDPLLDPDPSCILFSADGPRTIRGRRAPPLLSRNEIRTIVLRCGYVRSPPRKRVEKY